MNSIIPPDIRRFILDRIDSIAELEALLLLRNSPDTWWEDTAAAQRLYLGTEQGRAVLVKLEAAELLISRDEGPNRRWRYRPQSGDLREMVDRLAYYYTKHLVPVSNLVHEKSKNRLQEFSRAFDLPETKDP
ncbi:MAG TPA: hypothetical protein PKA61_03885 [Nitrospira sp.]|nr:hypothetical protein [Nitrospira sp.]